MDLSHQAYPILVISWKMFKLTLRQARHRLRLRQDELEDLRDSQPGCQRGRPTSNLRGVLQDARQGVLQVATTVQGSMMACVGDVGKPNACGETWAMIVPMLSVSMTESSERFVVAIGTEVEAGLTGVPVKE